MTTDWQRRHALQIASQLPDGLEDALAALIPKPPSDAA